MRHAVFTFMLMLAGALAGCHAGGSTPGTPSNERRTDANPLAPVSNKPMPAGGFDRSCSVYSNSAAPSVDDAFDCLKQACASAGGDWSQNICTCPRGYFFTGTMAPAFRCAPSSPDSSPAALDADGNLVSLVDRRSRLTLAADARVGGALPVHQVFASKAAALSLAGSVYLNEQTQAPFRSSFDDSKIVLLIDSTDDIARAFDRTNLKVAAAFDFEEDAPTEKQATARAVMDYAAHHEDELLAKAHAVVTSAYGCLDLCEIRSEFSTGSWTASWRRTYSRGSVARTQVLIAPTEAPENFNLILQLDPQGRVNMVLEQDLAPSQTALVLTTRVYDGRYVKVTELRDAVVKPFTQITDALNQLPAKPADAGTVIVCEDGFNPNSILFPNLAPFLKKVLRAGPHRAFDPSGTGSLLGWFANEKRSRQTFLSGFEPTLLDDGRDFNFDLTGETSDHLFLMASAIVSKHDTELSVIPMRFTDCIHRYEEWSSEMPKAGPRIVNVSMGEDHMDMTACASSEWRRAIDASRESQLWILATPNVPASDVRALQCPTSLSNFENTLIVTPTAMDDSTLIDPDHVHGASIVDLAVDGHSQNGGVSGSFAAARTSQVAALIALTHPELKPRDLKRALMLGIDATGVDVRAHGTLNVEKAKRAADLIAERIAQGQTISDAEIRGQL